MIQSPFLFLRPFADRIAVSIFIKEDDIRSDAAAAKTLGMKDAAGLNQAHGKRTVVVRGPSFDGLRMTARSQDLNRSQEADGMLTDAPDLLLCTRWADCQNFVMFAPTQNVCGVLHVGWRGLIAGAIPEFFTVLKGEWGIAPGETLVAAGPSICKQCAEFSDPARELPNISTEFINGKFADLQGAATAQFLELGVSPEHFERHPDCTRCNPQTYWTYRGGDRDMVKTGHSNMLVGGLKRS